MQFFLAGIMQGSHASKALHDQGYRGRLTEMLTDHFPDAKVYDPMAGHGQSLSYDHETGREVFYRHNRMCREVDVLIAFVPEASMGTAIEMWEAHEHGRGFVVTISPLSRNWAVKYCSHIVFENLEVFEKSVKSGDLQQRIADHLS